MPLLEAASSLAPSPPPGAERAGVRWGIPERSPRPTSPSHRCAIGSSLSPLKGGEGNSPVPGSVIAGAAIDVDRLAGDEAAILADQEQAGGGDLVDMPLASQG